MLFKARDAGLTGTAEWAEAIDILLRLLAPIAPHMAEELWERLGRGYSVHQQTWPKFDASAVVAETITIPVQVNGKLRDRITVPADADEAAIKDAALASEVVQKFLDGKPLRQVIYAKGRMLNLLV